MTEEQLSDLERIYGDIELIQYDETITDVKNYIDEFSNKKPKQKEKENNISYYKEL